MSTLKTFQTTEMSARRKLGYFQFAMLRAARVTLQAGTMAGADAATQKANFAAIQALYSRPWRKSTASAELSATLLTRGTGYVVGEVLTVVQQGASNGRFVVTSIDSKGGVMGVSPVTAGTNYSKATGLSVTTVQDPSGAKGCKLNITPSIGQTLDILDQVRVDMMTGYGVNVKDWGAAALAWLEMPAGSGTTGFATWAGTNVPAWAYQTAGVTNNFNVGALMIRGGSCYFCNTAHAAQATFNATEASYWTLLGTTTTVTPMTVLLCSITMRLAAITGE